MFVAFLPLTILTMCIVSRLISEYSGAFIIPAWYSRCSRSAMVDT